MPYKDKGKQKEAVKRAVDKHRGITKGITSEGITEQGITQYPAIIHSLVSLEKRKKLEAIYQSLKEFKVADKVFYGYPGLGGVPFDMVGEYLEATR